MTDELIEVFGKIEVQLTEKCKMTLKDIFNSIKIISN
jgi:hypothetical protein